jgi:hypothetical protein
MVDIKEPSENPNTTHRYYLVRVVERLGDYEFPCTFIAVICKDCKDDNAAIKDCVSGWRDDYANVVEDPEDVFTGPSGVAVELTRYHEVDKVVYLTVLHNDLLPILHI